MLQYKIALSKIGSFSCLRVISMASDFFPNPKLTCHSSLGRIFFIVEGFSLKFKYVIAETVSFLRVQFFLINSQHHAQILD